MVFYAGPPIPPGKPCSIMPLLRWLRLCVVTLYTSCCRLYRWVLSFLIGLEDITMALSAVILLDIVTLFCLCRNYSCVLYGVALLTLLLLLRISFNWTPHALTLTWTTTLVSACKVFLLAAKIIQLLHYLPSPLSSTTSEQHVFERSHHERIQP